VAGIIKTEVAMSKILDNNIEVTLSDTTFRVPLVDIKCDPEPMGNQNVKLVTLTVQVHRSQADKFKRAAIKHFFGKRAHAED